MYCYYYKSAVVTTGPGEWQSWQICAMLSAMSSHATAFAMACSTCDPLSSFQVAAVGQNSLCIYLKMMKHFFDRLAFHSGHATV